MKHRFAFAVPLCLVFAGLSFTAVPATQAQDQAGQVSAPPNVLEVITEYVKPGQTGSAHEKTEAAFVQA
jgi:hypothetical protein